MRTAHSLRQHEKHSTSKHSQMLMRSFSSGLHLDSSVPVREHFLHRCSTLRVFSSKDIIQGQQWQSHMLEQYSHYTRPTRWWSLQCVHSTKWQVFNQKPKSQEWLTNIFEFFFNLCWDRNSRGLRWKRINHDREWAARNGNTVYKYSLSTCYWTWDPSGTCGILITSEYEMMPL